MPDQDAVGGPDPLDRQIYPASRLIWPRPAHTILARKTSGVGMVGKFEGTKTYVATRDLIVAVNAAVTLSRPIPIKGEPGTGKTVLAHEIAESLGLRLIPWHIKSTTKAPQGLYEYDAVS